MSNSIVGLIPARSGSKRIQDKNIKKLRGHPLLAYTISAAIDSGVFDAVICATDDPYYADIARYYGAEVPVLRPEDISGDQSPDIEWVIWILNKLKELGRIYSAFAILRPTSPFRQPETIRRALKKFESNSTADSLRAIQKCKQHPGKMWVIRGNRILPVMPFLNGSTPWHSSQYAALPDIYAQDASLEIAWTRIPLEQRSIAGEAIVPFISQGLEGFDINQPEDWLLAEHYINAGLVSPPAVHRQPYELNSGRGVNHG